MKAALSRLFRIHEGEGKKVLYFALMGAFLQAGLAIGISSADSLFLVRVGAAKLPTIYLITPLMMLAYIPIYAYLMGRFGIERLVNITLGLLAVGGVAVYAGLTHAAGAGGTVIFYGVKLYAGLWFIALYTLVWNFIDCYFDILDAKRLFPLLSAGMAFGSIVGGSLVSLLVEIFSVEQLFLVWALLSVMTFPVVAHVRQHWKNLGQEEAEAEDQKVSFAQQTGVILKVLKTSRYSNFMILAFISTLVVTTICEYQYMTIFQQGRTAEQAAVLFGRLYALVNAFNVVVTLFLFNRIVAVLGVRNTALIQPLVYAVTFSYFLLASGFGAAVAGFFAYQGILFAIEYNNQNFLFNALPSRGKAEMRTFVEGICEPVATATGGLFLMVFAPRLSPQGLSVVGLAGTVVALFAVVGLRAHYLRAIVANLKKAWLDFSAPQERRLANIRYPELNIVVAMARSGNRTLATAAIRLLLLNDRMTGLGALLAYIDKGSPEDQRAAAPLLADVLREPDTEVFREVLVWLEKSKTRIDPLLLEECGRHHLLSDEDVRSLSASVALDRRCAAVVALWNSWKVDGNLECSRMTQVLLEGTEAERISALRVIGKSAQPRYAHFLALYLEDASPAVRREALASMAQLVNEESSRLVGDILAAIRRGDHAQRLLGMEALARIRNPDCIRPLALMSDAFTPFERRRAEGVIQSIGLQSVPILVALLKQGDNHSVVYRSLGRLAFPQFEALAPELINVQIRRAYTYLCAHWVLAPQAQGNADLDFLAGFYRDIQASVIDSILEILTISGRLPDYEQMAASLHSSNLKERGNAIETIEQGCSRDTFLLLLPLLDSRPLQDKVAFHQKKFRMSLPTVRDVILSAMDSRVPLESAAGFQAAWRLGEGSDPALVFDRKDLSARMHGVLKEPERLLEAEVIFSLLAEASSPVLSPVDRMHRLSKAEFFGTLSLPDLEGMARAASDARVSAGATLCRRGEPCGQVHVVLEGAATIRREQGDAAVGPGAVLGAEAFRGEGAYRDTVVSEGARVLTIPRSAVMEAANADPHVAIGLFAYKLGAKRSAA